MRRNRWFCCCLPGFLLLIVVPLGFLAFLFYQGSREPEDLPPKKTYSPEQVKKAQTRIESLKKRAEQTVRAAEKGRRQPFQFTISEDDLNAYLNRDPEIAQKLQAQGVRDVRIALGEDTVALIGQVPIRGRPFWIQAEGALRAGENGRILFEPSNIEFGRLKWMVPESVRQQLLEQLQKEARGAILRVPGKIEELRVTDGKLVLRGVTDPEAAKEMKRDAKGPAP